MKNRWLFSLVFFLFFCSVLDAASKLDAIFQRKETHTKNINEFEFQFVNHTAKELRVPQFLSGSFSQFFIVDSEGVEVKDNNYSPPGVKIDFPPRRNAYISKNNSSGYSVCPIPLNSGRFNLEKVGVYFLVLGIRKPDSDEGIFLSPPIKLEIIEGQVVGSFSPSTIQELPFKVKAKFLSLIIKRLQQEHIPVIKSDIPFF